MSESEGLDLSKVVNLIMENPHLIEEISKLAKGSESPETSVAPAEEAAVAPSPPPVATYTQTEARSKRHELLSAMKPYLSKERAKAIDSMITIADILGLMKER